jgi:cold shock CspA family protein
VERVGLARAADVTSNVLGDLSNMSDDSKHIFVHRVADQIRELINPLEGMKTSVDVNNYPSVRFTIEHRELGGELMLWGDNRCEVLVINTTSWEVVEGYGFVPEDIEDVMTHFKKLLAFFVSENDTPE